MNSIYDIASDLLLFTRYCFERNNKKFVVNHHHKIISDALMRVFKGEIKRLIINLPPRYSKTELAVVNFMAWCLGIYPDCEFIHISYSKRLAAKNSYNCRALVSSEAYQEIFPYTKIMNDSKARDEWRTEQGGVVYATGSDGTITGYGAGKLRDGFGGCFPYDQLVETENGSMAIGDIVTKKINVRVWSLNEKTRTLELKPIDTFWTNPSNNIIEIGMNNSIFRCTPNHKILTSLGWIEAMELSYSFDLMNRKVSLFSSLFSGFCTVYCNGNSSTGVFLLVVPRWLRKVFCNAVPSFSGFNLANYAYRNIIKLRKFARRFVASENLDNVISSEFCTRSSFKKRECSVSNSILHIVGLCSPSKIVKAIIVWISVKVSCFVGWWSRAYKSFKNKVSNVSHSYLAVHRKIYSKIALSITRGLNNSNRRFSPDIAIIRDFIETASVSYIKPDFVRFVGHEDVTFCLEIRDNHNFILSQSGVIVSNCIIVDDPHKAVEADSAIQRQNVIDFYESTVESRCNSVHTPIIVIMQRLHANDLAGWLLGGGSGDEWTHLKLPAIDDDGNALWSFKHTIERLRKMQEKNPYQFAGQYMQEPVPRDGAIIKPAWLSTTRYNVLPSEKIRIVQSWDTAYKDKQINDPSVCTTWLQTNNRYYLIESFVIRGDYPTIKRMVQSKFSQYAVDAVLIEDKSSGQSLIQELKQTGMPIIAIKPESDKVTRLNAVSSDFEAGKVWLPEIAAWLPDYETELFTFPKGKHDDQVDSTSQALAWMREKSAIEYRYIAVKNNEREHEQRKIKTGNGFSKGGW